MRKSIYLTLAFIAILIIACNNKNVEENPYEGAWVITYLKYVTPDSTIETTQWDNPSVKILTKKHFAFGRQAGENKTFGGGGEYTFKDTSYTEYIKYHGVSWLVGKSILFKSRIEGDLWTTTTVYKNDTIQTEAKEIWKRIIE